MKLPTISKAIIRIFCLTMISLAITITGYGQKWVYVGTDREGGETYVKDEYVYKNAYTNELRVWVKYAKKQLRYVDEEGNIKILPAGYRLILHIFDCRLGRTKVIAYNTYTDDGQRVHNWAQEEKDVEWVNVAPESTGEILMKKVCQLHN